MYVDVRCCNSGAAGFDTPVAVPSLSVILDHNARSDRLRTRLRHRVEEIRIQVGKKKKRDCFSGPSLGLAVTFSRAVAHRADATYAAGSAASVEEHASRMLYGVTERYRDRKKKPFMLMLMPLRSLSWEQ